MGLTRRTSETHEQQDTISFAFYGRVSTEENQDPTASRAWQHSISEALIKPRSGLITAEYFDIDDSRSIPWSRRPRAAALLEELKKPDRGFDAVVIGEPHRAFYGNQYSMIFPVFEHFQVPLWVPEVGGPIDPRNEAHDMIMSVFGGLSKGERNRVKVRVRAAMKAITTTEGRFLGGRPPYGYRLVDAGPHPNPAKAADGKRLRRLELDPAAAPVVRRIFAEFIAGLGLYAIAERLTADGIPCPSAHDRARNSHRTGPAWSKSAIRAILKNPRYTGRQVWNKQRKDEVLIDVDDVALGHATKLRWNPQEEWVTSTEIVHQPIVDDETFEHAQAIFASRTRACKGGERTRGARKPYALRGIIRCGLCNRKMQANMRGGTIYYRCKFPDEYALANKVSHPRNVYVREDEVIAGLDRWVGKMFAPHRLRDTIGSLHDLQDTGGSDAVAEGLRGRIAELNTKLDRHRAALEAGVDPSLVAEWTAKVQQELALARQQLTDATKSQQGRMSQEEIKALETCTEGAIAALAQASTSDKNDLYQQLGAKLLYQPGNRTVRVEMDLDPDRLAGFNPDRGSVVRVRGGT